MSARGMRIKSKMRIAGLVLPLHHDLCDLEWRLLMVGD
jgi:hypothetical protein